MPFGLACTGFGLVMEAWFVGGAPTAGEALELGFALEVPAALGPLAAAELVAVKGIVKRIVAEGGLSRRAGNGLAWSRLRPDYVAAIVWRSFTQHFGSRVQVDTIASQCMPISLRGVAQPT